MFLRGRNGHGSSALAGGANADAIICAQRVVKTYATGTSTVQALQGVDFAVAHGEMVGVMGPSGCGKTTLLNCLSGLDGVDDGQIWLEGKDLATMSDRDRTGYRERRMGFVFQVYNLLPVLDAVDEARLEQALRDFRNGPEAPEPGAGCDGPNLWLSGGTGNPEE